MPSSSSDALEHACISDGEISDGEYPESDWSSTAMGSRRNAPVFPPPRTEAEAARVRMVRVKLVSALSEEKTYSFPGPCRKDNNWTLAPGSWFVRDLLSQYVIAVKDEEDDVEVAELFKVSAVLYRTEGPAPESYTVGECAILDEVPKIGKLRLYFGEKVLPFNSLRIW